MRDRSIKICFTCIKEKEADAQAVLEKPLMLTADPMSGR